MTTTLTPTSAAPRITLATYTTSTGEQRELIGQRIDCIPRVTDEPAGDTHGETYTVEPDVDESKAALDALISDYLEKAAQLGYPPMHGWF